MSFVPTRLLVVMAAIPVGISLLAIGLPSAIWPMLAVDAVLAGVALLDLLATRGDLAVSRVLPSVQSVGRPFEVGLRVENIGKRRLRLRLADDPPGKAEGMPVAADLAPGGRAELAYPLTVDRRGEHRFGPITARWRSPLGLWERQKRTETEDTIRVYPDFAQLRSYGLKARTDEARMPTRTRRRPGGENEFERLRPYVPGDPYRHIDWRATARRGEFVSREFGQEVNQNLILMLDCGRMMSASHGDLTGFDHALNAALMMGQVALRHGDRVGLVAFDKKIRAFVPPRGGARAGSRLIRATYDVFPSLEEPDYAAAFRHLSHHVRRRSLVVLFTAVADAPNADMAAALVGGLGRRHLPVCVWLRDPGVHGLLDPTPGAKPDPYLRGAAAELVAWRERALAKVRRKGALVVDAGPEQLTTQLIARYLEVKARRLL